MATAISRLNRSFVSVLAVVSLLGGLLITTAWGHEPAPLVSRQLTDATVWVTTTAEGLVHPLDATVGRSGPPMKVEGASGDDLVAVQAGSDGYLVDRTQGSVRFIDAAARQFGPEWELEADGDLSFYAGPNMAWAYSGGTTHLLQRVLPGRDLKELGQAIPLVADGDAAVMEANGDLLLPDQADGQLARVSTSGDVADVTVAPAGNELMVRLVDERPVVVDLDARTAIVLDQDLAVVRECELQVTGAPVPAEGHAHDGRLAVLSGEQGALIVLDVATCASRAVPLGQGGEAYGMPLIVDGRVYVPDYSAGRVQIVDVGGSLDDDMAVTETDDLGLGAGAFELIAENKLVVFNDPASAAAGTIFPDGEVMNPGKFDVAADGLITSPATDEDAEREDAPDGRDDAQLTCASSRASAVVGQNVTFTASLAGDPTVAEAFEFTIDGATIVDDDGVYETSFDVEGEVEVEVRVVLATGGITQQASCGAVTVEASGQSAPEPFRCRSDVGGSARVDNDITFSANIPGGGRGWEWTFSDGDTTGEAAPTHRFSEPGPAWATIVWTGPLGRLEDTCEVTITAGIPPLEPSFLIEPSPIFVDQPVRVVSTTPNPDEVVDYAWSLDGAEPATAVGSSIDDVRWAEPGAKTVSLMVTNSAGQSFTDTRIVQVRDNAVQEVAGRFAIDPIGSTITDQTIDLSFSTLAGSARSASWEVVLVNDTGVPSTEASMSGYSASHYIPEHRGGSYTVTLSVVDSIGNTSTDSATFTAVRPLNPSVAASQTLLGSGEEVTFTGTAANPNVESWNWNFGDGSTAKGQTVTHSYSSSGSKTVTLTVTHSGASARDSLTVEVSDGGFAVVPDLSGRSERQARAELRRLGFDVGAVEPSCRAGVPVDQVFAQSVPAGTRSFPGDTVDIETSDGTDWQMPDLALNSSGDDYGLGAVLTVRTVQQQTAEITRHQTKASQSPAAGSSHCDPATADVVEAVFVPSGSPSLSCTAAAVFGEAVTCTASNNVDGGSIDWGDGSGPQPVGPGASLSHSYQIVGTATPSLAHDGSSFPGNTVSISPDATSSCSSGGEALPVWQLGPNGYVRPLDDDGEPIMTERVEIGTGQQTHSCSASSNALQSLGGSVSWVVTGPRFGSRSGTGSPWNPGYIGDWSGVQPGVITFTVTVGRSSVTTQQGVYLSGCG